jgi:hypothetical protein
LLTRGFSETTVEHISTLPNRPVRAVVNATVQVGQIVKRLDTDHRVRVIEAIPVSNTVFYRIEYDNGDHGLAQGMQLLVIP